jgi:hypothetical protein
VAPDRPSGARSREWRLDAPRDDHEGRAAGRAPGRARRAPQACRDLRTRGCGHPPDACAQREGSQAPSAQILDCTISLGPASVPGAATTGPLSCSKLRSATRSSKTERWSGPLPGGPAPLPRCAPHRVRPARPFPSRMGPIHRRLQQPPGRSARQTHGQQGRPEPLRTTQDRLARSLPSPPTWWDPGHDRSDRAFFAPPAPAPGGQAP